ncbi:phosphatase PAP2 family protein [Methylocella silvestris]|uniref:PA-phosphatase n=1 Tax=Methylocella silvestris TaxID=199596 RepID=A0A2J7TG55_METSI|nr:phosphatase PAP2 family protein [Methylocella silvestris]PNG25752.1 PA-phosphatase [Methylocella silvestris]
MKPPSLQTIRSAVARSGFQPLVALFLISALIAFALIVDEVFEGGTAATDRALLLALRTPADPAIPIGPPWLLQSAIDISALGGFTVIWLMTAAASGFLILARRWRALVILVAAIGGASVLNALIKLSFHRTRPDIVPHLTQSWSASFPSGHAMISAAAYLTIAAIVAETQTSKAVRLYLVSLAVLMTVAIGVSRIFLGVHWPSDIIAGWGAGAAFALCFWIIARKAAPETRQAQEALRDEN